MSPQLTESLELLPMSGEFVFSNGIGKPIDLDNWRKRCFDPIMAKAELKGFTPHNLRDSYTATRIAKGDNIVDVSRQLGHSKTEITEKHYYKWKPGINKNQVDGLDDPGFISMNLSAPYPHPEHDENKKWVAESKLTH